MSIPVQYTQSQQISMDGDPIAQLPVDQTPPSNTEVQIIDALFRQNRGTMNTLATELKDSLLVAFLFILISLPPIVGLIQRFVPITANSQYILFLIQGLIAGVLFWLIKHFYLSRR